MVAELRRIADALERGDDFVVVALIHCDFNGCGGPMMMVDSDTASVELADEMVETFRNGLFEALE